MSCSNCCRILLSILAACLGFAGMVMVFYGSTQIVQVRQKDAIRDGVATELSPFISCTDLRSQFNNSALYDTTDVKNIFTYQCETRQAPIFLAAVFTGLALFFATIAGLIVVNHSQPKTSIPTFHIMAAMTLALAIAGVAIVALDTSYTASRFIPCEDLDANTVNYVTSKLNVICVNGKSIPDNKTALKWLGDLIVFYTGAGLAMLTMLLLLFAHCCIQSDASAPSAYTDPMLQPIYRTQQGPSYV